MNGGICVNKVGSYECKCGSGLDGKHCENDIDECKNSPCKNGGKCVNAHGSFRCDCAQGYDGKLCDHDIDECINNPCQNTDNCSNSAGSYSCNCIQGFEGKNCEYDTDECKGINPCQNGGTCQNKVGTYKCVCPNGYSGFNCEIKKHFKALGCFEDKRNDRTMGASMLKNLRKYIDWRDMTKTVQSCAAIARSHSMYFFAIQYYGECWGGPASAQYRKHGEANNCWSGVGGPFSNFVYQLL